MRATWLLAACVAMALAGCAGMEGQRPPQGEHHAKGVKAAGPPSGRTQTCLGPGACNLWVSVNPRDGLCNVNVDFYVLQVKGTRGDARKIVWHIDNPDYRFSTSAARPGVVGNGGTTFFRDVRVENQTAQLTRTLTGSGTAHEYVLNLESADGTMQCDPFDPWVIE